MSRNFLPLTVLVAAATAYAQTSRGTVSGAITDPTGAVITGARVSLTAIDTGVRRSTISNEVGIYRFDAVDLGVYELQVAHPGFRTFRSTGIGVAANRVTTVDPRLELGTADTQIEVSGETSEVLTKDGPLRGGNFQPRGVRDLPLIGLDPLSLVRTLPGVTVPSGSSLYTNFTAAEVSINGQRPRGNNYLLDGTENNDIAFTGVAQPFNITDAVEEVSVQTGNFGVEFGRAGGGVFNVVTKSGTNNLHGSVFWRYQSQRFESIRNTDRLNGIPQSVFVNNIFGVTVGGPVRKNKTFFFGGFQQNNRHATSYTGLTLPTNEAVARLRSLFLSNPRLDLYLGAMGDWRGSANPISLPLGADPRTGSDRGSVQFGTAAYVAPLTSDSPQWLAKVDHYLSDAHRLSWRHIYDSRTTTPLRVFFPGFITDSALENRNFLFADSYTFGPSFTNEFRFSYGKLDAEDSGRISPKSSPLAYTLPQIVIPNISAPGVQSNQVQYRHVTNLLFQETQTKLSGRHALRYGIEFLRQIATQRPAAFYLGQFAYRDSTNPAYTAFANFLDDFSGPSGVVRKVFGADDFHPNQFRQSYFFQDHWKVTPSLALTLGLRYENFGQPANVMKYPAFAGFDPALFLVRNEVNRDDNNFGPAFGLAWSPEPKRRWLGKLFGDRRTVWRGGYQISYDAFFTRMISLNLASSTPNAISTMTQAQNTGRGLDNFFARLPTAASAPSLMDEQPGAIEKDLRSPYTERWSLGFQRQLPDSFLMDVSYIGSVSHKLATFADWNPRALDGKRLYPELGQRRVITSQGNSAYHALQARLDRRFTRGIQFAASYTWSRMLDSTSEGVGGINTQSGARNMTSIPVSHGGLKLDRGVSDYDRPHRLTVSYLWHVPSRGTGLWRHVLGGWSIAGIITFQSGTPFTIANGFDRNNDVFAADRADIGNAGAPLNSRAVAATATGASGCFNGYRNPDTNQCVSPGDVRWAQGSGLPTAATVGRNTLRTNGTNNIDANLTKWFPLGEKRRLEFRWEAFNALNHPQFILVPERTVVGAPAGRFLNRDYTDSGIRSMWVQVKLVF